MSSLPRSELTIDLGALRRNAATMRRIAGAAELWAVVKADAYGHGAVDCARVLIDAGASALCVATVGEALEVRAALPEARIVVLGPAAPDDIRPARDARLVLVVGDGPIPDDVEVHLKLDTGMGRWGYSELPVRTQRVTGVMTHFATADGDLAFVRLQLERFLAATSNLPGIVRHAANSAATLRLPESRLDAVRCGIALYGISPFGTDASDDGLEPVLGWRSVVAATRRLKPGDSTGYGRSFVAGRETWIGVVPIGYADGFRRDLTGTFVAVDGERCRVVGTVSMDAVAVELPVRLDVGTPVVLVGDGCSLEEHARVAETIPYELACAIGRASPARTSRKVING